MFLARSSFFIALLGGAILIIYVGMTRAEQSASINQYLTSQCHYGGDFKQIRRVASVPVPLISKGRFLFSCENGLIWQTLQPIQQTVIYTTDQINFEINSDNQVKHLKGIVHQNMAQLLIALLRGDGESIEALFTVTSDKSNSSTIALLPRRSAVRKHLERITLSRNGDALTIDLINNPDESTKIVTDNLNQYDAIDLVQCELIIDASKRACEALLLPQLIDESLTPER